jgi:peptide/nickel transport system ATP-binding protein
LTDEQPDQQPLLVVRDLTVELDSPDGVVHAVSGVSFTVGRGEVLGVVGESGSGKTITSLSIMGLLNRRQSRVSGQIRLEDDQLLTLSDREMREVRRHKVAMIYQDPFASLHPMYRIGTQIGDTVRIHTPMPRRQAFDRAVELLERVGVPDARQRARDYPHQFSGGMRQRAMIAMALAHEPALLIADEPTTALDVTVQSQILDLLDDLRRELRMGLLFITHDLGLVQDIADSVLVMYAGQVMEYGSVDNVLERPQHPYTWGLLDALPSVERRRAALTPIPGSPPSPLHPPPGCPFHPRCARAFAPCPQTRPELRQRPDQGLVACHLEAAERQHPRKTRSQSGEEASTS